MAENDFLPFAIGAGANVQNQTDYAASAALSTGFQTGIAQSAPINKAIRQATFVAAAMATFIVNQTGDNVLDNGNLSAFVAEFTAAITAASGGGGYLPLTGGTLTGPLQENGAAGTNREIGWQTSGAQRWLLAGADNETETGSNAGSNFKLNRYSDAGTFIDSPLVINRNSGLVTLVDGLTVQSSLTAPNSSITNAMLANMAGLTLKGNNAGGSAAPTDLSISQVVSMLGVFTGSLANPGYANLSGVIFQWLPYVCPPTGGTVGVTFPITFPGGPPLASFFSGTYGYQCDWQGSPGASSGTVQTNPSDPLTSTGRILLIGH